MDLKTLAQSIGVTAYPDGLEQIYKTLDDSDELICDVDFIRALDKKYDLLGDYLDEVIAGAVELREKKELLTWARLAYAYCSKASLFDAKKMTFPVPDGSRAVNMLPALVLIREVPEMVARYERRGFDEAQIKKNLENIRINIWVHEITQGVVALSKNLYGWLTNYTKALIFDHKGFNYQVTTWSTNAIVIKSEVTGEREVVMLAGRFHKNGLVLGSAGATDEDGAFDAAFYEDDEIIKGRKTKNGRVQAERSSFDKREWKVVLRPGDDVVSLHIPRKTNLDPDSVSESLREGLEIARRLYPEHDFKCVVCLSWLMEPALAEILGPDAKLTGFTTRFTKHPLMDSGKNCLGYVWPGEKCPVEELSEKTSLQRGIKKLMLEGDFIRSYAGIIVGDL